MFNVIIADDDTVIRASIKMMIDWESIGFLIVGEAIHGRGVLELLSQVHADIVLTDINMPVMNGIELMEQMRKLPRTPYVIILSAFNDFHLVRKAFRLGAEDYLLKTDMNETTLTSCFRNLRILLEKEEDQQSQNLLQETDNSITDQLKGYVTGRAEVPGDSIPSFYYLVCFGIVDFEQVRRRFHYIEQELIQPLLQFAKQVPRINSKCLITSISASNYVLLYEAEEKEDFVRIKSICRQLMTVWKNYMNIVTSAGISNLGISANDFGNKIKEAYHNLSMQFIFGREGVYTSEFNDRFKVEAAIDGSSEYMPLINSIKNTKSEEMFKYQREVFPGLFSVTLSDAKTQCLSIIYSIAVMLSESEDSIFNLFDKNINFYDKLQRLESNRDVEMWLINFCRWVFDYIEHKYESHPVHDAFLVAKRFMEDNYSDEGITLGAVASVVGFNEKYFSSRFSQEFGQSFISYLTELRIHKAMELMEKTNMKVYEISEAVGYSSVEHFTRVFKKKVGISPAAFYKK
ncbi:MAG: response regulator [Anaerocolumna sp.]